MQDNTYIQKMAFAILDTYKEVTTPSTHNDELAGKVYCHNMDLQKLIDL
jgi:hypothetical protein